MRSKKFFIALSLIFLSLLFLSVGCGGQKSGTRQSQETAAPATPSDQTAGQSQEATGSTATAPATPPSYEREPGETGASAPSREASRAKEEPSHATGHAPAATEPASRPVETATATEGVISRPSPGETASPRAPQEAAPAPQPVAITIPAGTVLDVAFIDPLSSKTSNIGDTFRTEVKKEITQNGVVVIPAGSIVRGSVTEAISLKKIGGQAKIALDFSSLELTNGEAATIKASFAEQGKSETKKDAVTIGGATAGGAILGRVLSKKDKGKATAIGAILGAAAGTVIAAKTQGEEVEIPEGTEVNLQLSEPVTITVYR